MPKLPGQIKGLNIDRTVSLSEGLALSGDSQSTGESQRAAGVTVRGRGGAGQVPACPRSLGAGADGGE